MIHSLPTLFILGAGISVDSGLPTYRGVGGIYKDDSYVANMSFDSTNSQLWSVLKPMYQQIETTVPGNSYIALQKLIDLLGVSGASCRIMTQNIDGLVCSIQCDQIIELHGTWKNVIDENGTLIDTREILNTLDNQSVILENYRPNIILFGDNLRVSKTKLFSMLKGIKQVIVIGTSMQFPYLQKVLAKARHKGCSIIHINPDKEYQGWSGKDRILRHTAESGLELLISKLIPNNLEYKN